MYDAKQVLTELVEELDELKQGHLVSAATMTRARQVIGRQSKFAAMTPAQQQHCCFMGYDPDNPEIPLD